MKGFIKTWWQGEKIECTYCKNGCYFTGDRCKCPCHTPQSVEKEEKHKTLIDEIANHTSNYLRSIPQSVEKEECKHCWNTEYENEKVDHQDCENCCNCKISYQDRLKISQPTTLGTTMEERLATEYKEYENREVELSREKIIRFWLEKLSQSKAETIKECKEKMASIYIEKEKDQSGRIVSSEEYEFTQYSKGFNQALKTLSDLLSKDIEQ